MTRHQNDFTPGRQRVHLKRLRREKPWWLIAMAVIIGPFYMAWAFAPDVAILGEIAILGTFMSAVVVPIACWRQSTEEDSIHDIIKRKTWGAVVQRRQLVLAEGITPAYSLCQHALEALSGKAEISHQHPGKGEIVALKTYEDGATQDIVTIDAKLESSSRTRVEITSRAYRSSVPIEHADTKRDVAALEDFLERHARIIRD